MAIGSPDEIAIDASVCRRVCGVIREALDAGAVSDEVILNILARYREPASERPLDVVVDLKLSHPPIADCARYDTVRGLDAAA